MKKIVITTLCLLLLPAFALATADAFQTNGDILVPITIGDTDITLTLQSSGTVDQMVVSADSVQFTLSANSSAVILDDNRRILANDLNIGTTCETSVSKLILPAQSSETTITITPSIVDYCGGSSSGVAQISTPSAADTTGTTDTTTETTETAAETTTEETAETVTETTGGTVAAEEEAEVTTYQDGDLIRAEGDEKVYLIQDGKKKHITSAAAFESAGYSWADIKVIAFSVVESYEDYSSSTLYKTASAPEVYVVVNNRKRHIPSIEVFNAYGFNWSDIAIIPEGGLETYETADLYRASGDTKIYKIANGKKTWIKTAAEFNAAGYDWNKVIEVDPIELAAYPDSGLTGVSATTGETILIKASALRVRSAASLSGSVLDSVRQGETYQVLEESGGWYKITTSKGITGWCYGGDTGGYAAKQ